MPSGSGNENRKRCGVNLKNRMLRKHCFVTVKNKDELCAARAIVTAIARLEGFSNYASYSDGKSIQRTKWNRANTMWNRGNQVVSRCVTRLLTGRGQGTILMPLSTKASRLRSLFIFIITVDTTMSLRRCLRAKTKCEKGYNTEDWRHHPCTTK